MDAEPKRPQWRKWRWRIASVVVLLLPISCPVSMAPAMYCVGRGWAGSMPAVERAYAPLIEIMNEVTSAARPSMAVVEVTTDDGRTMTVQSDPNVSTWAPPIAAAAQRYWDFVCWCHEMGERHRASARRVAGAGPE